MACNNTAVYAALPKTERGRGVILGSDPKGKTFLYTNGHSVIIRDIANPANADIYTEHATAVNVAKYSPSGFYIASGDQSGRVRIWDTTNKEHILKNEFPIFAGPIRDLSWSSDSQRIVVGGEGRERFGHVFAADTGTSVGEIGGPSKPLNTVDFKPSRPFRIITASEDGGVTNFAGPPFKFEKTCSEHQQSFVNCARYDPKGDKFASCGSDGRIFIYDGKSAEKLSELLGEGGEGKHAHDGGVYSISWTPDGKQLLSASGDKTCKLWDVETGKAITTFALGRDQQDMQLGCLCQGDYLLSVSAAGFINYLDKSNPSKPLRILQGHVKPITALCAFNGSIYSGASDATITKWNGSNGEHERVGGLSNTGGHQNQIVRLLEDLSTTDAGEHAAMSAGMDDVARFISGTQFATDYAIQTGTTPTSAATVPSKNQYVVSNAANEILICNRANKSIARTKLPYGTTCVAVRPKPVDSPTMLIAVGGDDQKTHLYAVPVDGSSPLDAKNELASFEHMGIVTDVAFSPCGTYLASADANRKIHIFKIVETDDGKTVLERALPKNIEWGSHTARVNSIAWSPNSKRLASGSLDTHLCVWNIENPKDRIMVKNAHRMAGINGVAWLGDKTIVTGGQDANIKLWQLS